MKVGIYSKWIETLGGGEKVATTMAEVLSKKGHEVDLISTFKTNKEVVEKRMGVDLSKVKMVAWNERSYNKLLPKTKKYDLFINVSFLDLQPNSAKKSIYYILFPLPVRQTMLGFIKYETILPLLRRFLIIPIVSKGLTDIGDVVARAGRWLEDENTIILQNPPNKFTVKFRIYSGSMTLQTLNGVKIRSTNSKITMIDKQLDHHTSTLVYECRVEPKKGASAVINIEVDAKLRRIGVALVSMTVNSMRYTLWNLFKRFLPRYEMALYGSSTYSLTSGYNTYDMLLADSLFTKKWNSRYWRRKSELLYPPIDVDMFKNNTKKKNIILNVGRFFVGGHSKRQDVLVKGFKQLIDKGLLKDKWELHLVGGVAPGWEHANYIKSIEEDAKGYPIYFHYGIDFKDLKKLFAQAKIYWHAAGFGQNELRNAIAFEHFGIAPVEAMSAGCVPILYKGGGLAETMGEKKELLWKSIEGLTQKTAQVANNEKYRKSLAKYFTNEADKYSRQNFEKNFIKYVNKIV